MVAWSVLWLLQNLVAACVLGVLTFLDHLSVNAHYVEVYFEELRKDWNLHIISKRLLCKARNIRVIEYYPGQISSLINNGVDQFFYHVS